MADVLTITSVTKRYRNVTAVDRLSFSVARGEIFGRMRGMDRALARRETGAWLERFDLGDRRGDKLDTLSKGNQQKVQLVSAILHRPELAVLDEPFSGLDPVNQDLFLDLLRELRDGGMTILLSAHQMDLVERCVDRLLILQEGRRVLEGTLDSLRARRSGAPRLRISLDGAPPPSISPEDATIETVTRRADGDYDVVARSDASLSMLLDSVSRWPGLREVATERQRLHEIYVEVVAGAGGDGAPPLAGEAS